MTIYLTEKKITCLGCGKTRKTTNNHTISTSRCAKCRLISHDESQWLTFTCSWCQRPKKAGTEQRAEGSICSECELICSTCKGYVGREIVFPSVADIRSNAEIENNPVSPTPQQLHHQSCGRRKCEDCKEWCIGTLELFNEHRTEHQQQAQILQLPNQL